MEQEAMKYKAVTVSTIGIPPMEFEFEAHSPNAAMDYMCRAVPIMRGAPAYDFELWTLPEAGVDGPGAAPQLLGRTKTTVTTRFIKEPGVAAMARSASMQDDRVMAS